MRIDPDFDRRRPSSEGKAFVYVLPLRSEELLKLGFSRDPAVRMQSLHARYFEFFDLDRVFVIETDRVREARRMESELKRAIEIHRAPAPLEVSWQARGETEWYRGAYASLCAAARELAQRGFSVRPGNSWLRDRLLARSGDLYEWSLLVFEQMRLAHDPTELVHRATLAATLRDRLDALTAVDIDVAQCTPVDVVDWYCALGRNDVRGQ